MSKMVTHGTFLCFKNVNISRLVVNKYESEDKVKLTKSSISSLAQTSNISILVTKDGLHWGHAYKEWVRSIEASFQDKNNCILPSYWSMHIRKLSDFLALVGLKSDKVVIDVNLEKWAGYQKLSIIKEFDNDTDIELRIVEKMYDPLLVDFTEDRKNFCNK